MKRYFIILLFVFITFLGLAFYWFETRPKHRAVSGKCDRAYKAKAEWDANPARGGSSIYNKIESVECIKGHPAAANKVIVKFKEDISSERITNLLKNIDVEKSSKFSEENVYIITARQTSAVDLVKQFSKLNEVVWVEPDYISGLDSSRLHFRF
jgi:hypothetical protein